MSIDRLYFPNQLVDWVFSVTHNSSILISRCKHSSVTTNMNLEASTNTRPGAIGIRRANSGKALERFIVEQIETGRMQPGFRLPAERQLSEDFGASRNTVRRVLAKLKDRGLIVQAAGSGTFVSQTATPADHAAGTSSQISPAELMQARLLIEPSMALLISTNATPSDFDSMERLIKHSEAAETVEEFERLNDELHHAFALATHNRVFIEVISFINNVKVQGQWGSLRRNSLTPENRAQYEREHRELFEALRDRNAKRATELLKAHMDHIQKSMFHL
jgi:DNA-binding FadR family transcriptional regulator